MQQYRARRFRQDADTIGRRRHADRRPTVRVGPRRVTGRMDNVAPGGIGDSSHDVVALISHVQRAAWPEHDLVREVEPSGRDITVDQERFVCASTKGRNGAVGADPLNLVVPLVSDKDDSERVNGNTGRAVKDAARNHRRDGSCRPFHLSDSVVIRVTDDNARTVQRDPDREGEASRAPDPIGEAR